MAKEGSSDYKKLRKRWFFKEPLTEILFVEPKMVLLWHRCEEPFKHLYLKNNNKYIYIYTVYILYIYIIYIYIYIYIRIYICTHTYTHTHAL